MVSEHPSRDELAALRGGGLSPAREREVLHHLLSPCGACLAAAPPPLSVLLGCEPARRRFTAAESKACDAAIGRAFKTLSEHARHLRREQAKARKIVAALKEKGWEAAKSIHHSVGPMARMIAFMDWSWQLRHEAPEPMVQSAFYAALASRQLDAGYYGLDRVFDFQARAYAELGNAYRVQHRLHDAEDTLGYARQLFERGTGDERLEVRLLELEASLASDRRKFGRAFEKLLKVLDFYKGHSELHLAGRTLILMGLYTGYAGNLEKGLQLLQKGQSLLEKGRDPRLEYSAVHNQLLFLVDSGRLKDARKFQLIHSRTLAGYEGRLNQIRLRALDGRIDYGMEKWVRAEATFREAHEEYMKVGRFFEAAIASLDLTAALLAQGKSGEAYPVALKAAKTFIELGIQREGLQAVILLRDAVKQQTATLEMVEEVARFLRRLEIDPALRFEGRAWEGFDPDPDGLC